MTRYGFYMKGPFTIPVRHKIYRGSSSSWKKFSVFAFFSTTNSQKFQWFLDAFFGNFLTETYYFFVLGFFCCCCCSLLWRTSFVVYLKNNKNCKWTMTVESHRKRTGEGKAILSRLEIFFMKTMVRWIFKTTKYLTLVRYFSDRCVILSFQVHKVWKTLARHVLSLNIRNSTS